MLQSCDRPIDRRKDIGVLWIFDDVEDLLGPKELRKGPASEFIALVGIDALRFLRRGAEDRSESLRDGKGRLGP